MPTVVTAEAPPLVKVAYPVADLVVPIASEPQTTTHEKRLMALITGQFAPNSWMGRGGPGSVNYYPLGMALVVDQTPAVQAEVAQLLQGLRRLRD
jgi:hypothetical protein